MIEKRVRYKTRRYGFKVTLEEDCNKEDFDALKNEGCNKILKVFRTKNQINSMIENAK